jgi:hypothetical protein
MPTTSDLARQQKPGLAHHGDDSEREEIMFDLLYVFYQEHDKLPKTDWKSSSSLLTVKTSSTNDNLVSF